MPAPFDPVDVIGLPIDQKRSLQGERLKALVARLASCGNPFWSERLADVEPSSINSVDDLPRLPFTIKQDGGFKGVDKKVKCLGHSTLSKFKDITFAKNKDEGTLDLNLNTYKLPVGEHVLYLRTQVKGKYSRVTKARIDAAKEEQKKADASAAESDRMACLLYTSDAADE